MSAGRLPIWAWAFLLTFAVGLAAALVHRGALTGDHALIELQTRQLLSTDVSLTGPYSRFGWAHPGPAMFILLWPAYAVFGSSGTSLMIAAALVNASFVAATMWIAGRHHRLLALGTAVIVAVTLLTSDAALLTEPWGPRLVVLPSIMLLMSLPLAVAGDHQAAGLGIVAAGFVMSSHVGIGAALIPATVFGLMTWWWHHRTWPPRWSLAIAALFVAPIVADTLFRSPGNAWRVVRFAASDDSAQLGIRSALRFLARASSPEFLRRERYDGFAGFVSADQPLGAVPGLLLIALAVIAVIGSSPFLRTAARTSLAVALGAAWSISNLRGDPFAYLLVILPIFAITGWAVVVGEGATRVILQWPDARRRLQAAVIAALVLGSAGAVVSEMSRTHRNPNTAVRAREVAAVAEEIAADGPILFAADVGDPFQLIGYFGGVMNELDRAGVDVRVLPGTAEIVGERRNGDPNTMPFLTLSVGAGIDDAADRGIVVFISDEIGADGQRVRLHLLESTSER